MIDLQTTRHSRLPTAQLLFALQRLLSVCVVLALGSCIEKKTPTATTTTLPDAGLNEELSLENNFNSSEFNAPDPLLQDVEVLTRFGHYLDALEITTQQLRQRPKDENLLYLRTLIFLQAGQPELAALSNDEHARALGLTQADGLIRALLHNNESVRTTTIQALDISEDTRRFEAVMPLAATDDSQLVRVAALRLLRKSDDDRLKHTFLALSRDDAWIVRAEAIESLSRWNDSEVRAAVWRATDDDELLVKHRARGVISSLYAPQYADEYIRMAQGNDVEIAVAAALALANAGDTRAAPTLIEALLHSDDISIRRESARALGKIPGHDASATLDALHSALEEPDTTLRTAVLDALEMLADGRSIDPLTRFSRDPLVPAVLSRRAFELLRILRANLTESISGVGIFSVPDSSEPAEETPE